MHNDIKFLLNENNYFQIMTNKFSYLGQYNHYFHIMADIKNLNCFLE